MSETLNLGVRAYSQTDWEDHCEFNVDLEEPSRIIHIQQNYTPREHYLLGHLAIRKNMSINALVISILKASGVFDNRVDFYGKVEYLKVPKLDTDINYKKTKKPKDITGQALLFGEVFEPKKRKNK